MPASSTSHAPLASDRLPGLDLLRALAVLLVVLHHYTLFVSRDDDTFGWVGRVGWIGVDLFFALSGYLIGSQIFAALRGSAGLSLPRFYARRLLRTLPNYLAVLLLYWTSSAVREDAPLLPLWRYLSFTQNIGLAPGTAFSHSWSLAIEEQFYLVLPALAMLAFALGRRLRLGLRAALAALALVVVAGMLLRAQLWFAHVEGHKYGVYAFYKLIYYASFCRLDELVAGVGLALLKNAAPGLWTRLHGQGNPILAAALLVLAPTCVLLLDDRYGFAAAVFGYPLLALGFGLLILAAVSKRSWLGRLRIPGAASLALWSYAIYLVHRAVGALAAPFFSRLGHGPETPLAIVLILLMSVLAGWLLYLLVETPFMRLRERYVPGNSAPGRLSPAPR